MKVADRESHVRIGRGILWVIAFDDSHGVMLLADKDQPRTTHVGRDLYYMIRLARSAPSHHEYAGPEYLL